MCDCSTISMQCTCAGASNDACGILKTGLLLLLQRCKGGGGRQRIWRDGYAFHREVWNDGPQTPVQV